MTSFVPPARRPLPIFLIADTSGSMKGEKIATLNHAIRTMMSELGELADVRGDVQVALITFGAEPRLIQSLTPANQANIPELNAEGKTPLGGALELVSAIIEDDLSLPLRAFAPSLVLMSDGAPTDLPEELKVRVANGRANRNDFLAWEPIAALHRGRRGRTAQRLALSIGAGDVEAPTHALLEAFINTPGIPVVHAADTGGISRFLRWVTLSVASRTLSRDPNVPVLPSLDPFENNELIF